MANVAIIILFVAVVAVVIVFAILIGFAVVASRENARINPQPAPTSNTPCAQLSPRDGLIPLPPESNCITGGVDRGLYYIGNIDQNLDYVVASWPTSVENVCIKFCESLDNGVCNGPAYNGISAQANFDRCVAQLSGDGQCAPPIPLARRDATLYYAFAPTCANVCDRCTPT